MKVVGKTVKVWDAYRNQYRQVAPVLAAAYADTPARRGWALATGHTGRSGCDKCGLRSTRLLPSGDTVGFGAFCGYSAPATALVYDEDKQVPLLHISAFPSHIPGRLPWSAQSYIRIAPSVIRTSWYTTLIAFPM